MYHLSVKETAIESNQALADLVEKRGTLLKVDSKAEAEKLATSLSRSGTRVRVQKAAPQDPTDADGYLIGFPKRHISEPKDSDTQGLTFDLGANQYGEVGKALICGSYELAPGVKYYFYEEFDHLEKEKHRLRGISEPYLPEDISNEVSWSPDCLIQVRSGKTLDIEEQYFCEIKAGDASFERSQARDMKTVARPYNTLKIRVIIEDLPDEYTIRFQQVKAD